jgi:hypothetical protein
MDRPLVTRQEVDAAHGSPDNVSRLEGRCRGLTLRKDRRLVPIKLSINPPFAGTSFPSRPARVPSSATPSQSTHSLVWNSNLISMAFMCCQPIAPSYPYASYASIVKLGFQFSKSPPSSDASVFGCAARFDLSAMDLPAPMNRRVTSQAFSVQYYHTTTTNNIINSS